MSSQLRAVTVTHAVLSVFHRRTGCNVPNTFKQYDTLKLCYRAILDREDSDAYQVASNNTYYWYDDHRSRT